MSPPWNSLFLGLTRNESQIVLGIGSPRRSRFSYFLLITGQFVSNCWEANRVVLRVAVGVYYLGSDAFPREEWINQNVYGENGMGAKSRSGNLSQELFGYDNSLLCVIVIYRGMTLGWKFNPQPAKYFFPTWKKELDGE
jgi:hypothetical protein